MFAFVVAAAHAGAAVTSDGVDFVDEDDGGRVRFGLFEQVAHAAGADADEHFDEVGSGDGVEGYACFAGDGAGEEGFAGSWGAVQEYAFGDAGADGLELGGVFQEVFDFVEFFDGFVGSGDVVEGDLGGFFGDEFGFGFAELHDLVAAALHPGQQEPEDDADEDEGDEEAQHGGEPVAFVDLVVEFGEAGVGDGGDHFAAAWLGVVELHLFAFGAGFLEDEVDALFGVDDGGGVDFAVGEKFEALLRGDAAESGAGEQAEAHGDDDDREHDVEERAAEEALEVHERSGR